METLVGAHRANDPILEADYRRTLGDPSIWLLPIDQDTLGLAAKLRAMRRSMRKAIRTADAIHRATAELAGCGAFVTNDKSLRSSFPNVVVLDDLREPG